MVLNPACGAVDPFTRRGSHGPVGRGLADASPICGLNRSADLRALSRVVASFGTIYNEAYPYHQHGAGGLAMVRKGWRFVALRPSATTPTDLQRHRTGQCRLVAVMLLVLGIVASPRLRAQAIIAPGGRTLFNRSSLVRSFAERIHLSVQTPDGKFTDVTQYIMPLAFVYAFAPKWQVIAIQPYVTADIRQGAAGQAMTQNMNGLSDSQFILQYDGLYSRNAPGGLTRLSGLFGVKAPTGAERFSSGAFGYTGGLVFEKVSRLRYAFTADFQYTVASENEVGLSQGNTVQYDVAPAYFMIPREGTPADAGWMRRTFDHVFLNGAFAIVEFNGTSQARAFARGTGAVPNSGGTTLYVSPGIQYFVSRSFLAEFSAPIPVVRDLNGIQLRPDSRFVLGFRWLF